MVLWTGRLHYSLLIASGLLLVEWCSAGIHSRFHEADTTRETTAKRQRGVERAIEGQAPNKAATVTIEWDRRSPVLIQAGGGYGRMIRLQNGDLLCAYEQNRRSWVRHSKDNGKTWQPAILAAMFPAGTAANPELVQLRNGWLLLPFNERPRDGKSPFTIRLSVSKDGGQTWETRPPVYVADSDPHNGCWEPAALQLPSGEVQLLFANESPYRTSDEQEITLLRSFDNGVTWTAGTKVSFRRHHRDGMPVPLLLQNGQEIALSIEDNGRSTNKLQPAIIVSSLRDNWKQPAAEGPSPRRWQAIEPPLPAEVYAGAPYLRQLPGGETLLSCQSDEGGRHQPQMAVYIGDSHARHFAKRTLPFTLAPTVGAYWNSLCIKDNQTITALSSTAINGVGGLWAIDGHIVRSLSTTGRP